MTRIIAFIMAFVMMVGIGPVGMVAIAAPYAAMVMDARTGEVLHSRSADTRLHPASLTKMMTLYIVFEAVEHGEISLDTVVTIPSQAANEPPTRLGLRAGQKIKLRYLVRAAAIKSANDAATALGYALEGSEEAFARRMNRTAKAMGMTRTTFRNAHGLTQQGHLSTARDMSLLGRHIIYDYPQYYNLFSRLTGDAGVRRVSHTNQRFLKSYRGADGIKTGYTRAAGFNLVASAVRGNTRIVTTVFGGSSTTQRNARVAQLMDMGFARAPSRARLRRPEFPAYRGGGGAERRTSGAVARAIRPVARRLPTDPAPATLASSSAIEGAVALALMQKREPLIAGISSAPVPPPRPDLLGETTQTSLMAALSSSSLVQAEPPVPSEQIAQEVVARVSTSSARNWGINVGRYTTKYQAERVLLKVALNEMETLDGGLRRVASSSEGHDATFMGLGREQADLACRRLQAKNTPCVMLSP